MGKTRAPRTKICSDAVSNPADNAIKKKRTKKVYVKKYLLELSPYEIDKLLDPQNDLELRCATGQVIPIKPVEREVILRKTDEEVKNDRRAYRKEYHKREDVIEKNRERLRRPEVIEK